MHFQQPHHSGEDVHLPPAADTHLPVNISLDDVFAIASPEHPSDMQRLESEHATSGYREAITIAKAATAQAGFDEGYALGATLGQRAGRLLGILEGIANALRGEHGDDESAEAAIQLLNRAREELAVSSLFHSTYWASDGNWTFDVEPAGQGQEVLFPHVADAHPLIRKWTLIVDEQTKLWAIDEAILVTDNNGLLLDSPDEAPVTAPPATTAKKPLDW